LKQVGSSEIRKFLESTATEIMHSLERPDLETLFKKLLNSIGNNQARGLDAQIFEKDDDSNFHIDYIYSVGNLRAATYSIPPMDWLTVKIKAGRIIPALATTTAVVSGFQALELVKVADYDPKSPNKTIEDFNMSQLNLSTPSLLFCEPHNPKLHQFTEKAKFTVWDKIVINCTDLTLREFCDKIHKKYQLHVGGINVGVTSILNDENRELKYAVGMRK
jgi:hypothetical protein